VLPAILHYGVRTFLVSNPIGIESNRDKVACSTKVLQLLITKDDIPFKNKAKSRVSFYICDE
jgi:hypothetical protein